MRNWAIYAGNLSPEDSSYEEWFVLDVDTGLEQIENGRTLSHAEVGTRIEAMLAAKKASAAA